MTAFITLPQAPVIAGESGHLTDHNRIEASIAALWGAVQQSMYNVASPTYGAKLDGVTDDTTAFQNAINTANAAGGGVVCVPAGTAIVNGLNMSGTIGVHLVGAGPKTSILKKSTNGTLLSLSGPSSDTTGATHAKYCSIQNIGFDGGGFTGLIWQLYYTDNCFFRDCRTTNNADVCVGTAEFWDSRFYNCVWESNGSTTANANTPNVWLRNSTASSGFGASTDNCNDISFIGCRWEDFRTGAVWIQQGVSNSSNANNIWFEHCKMETHSLNGGPHLLVDNSCRAIFADGLYCYSGGFTGGYSTAQDVIQWSAQDGELGNVFIADSVSAATVANGVTINSTVSTQNTILRNVTGIYGTAPTGGHVGFGTSTGGFVLNNVTTNTGTLYSGSAPTKYAGNSPITQTSGTPSDSSFPVTPLDGTLAIDTSAKRFYVRHTSGAWSRIPINTIGTSVTSTTTVANSNSLTALQSVTVTANYPQGGTVYTVRGYGVYSVTGTPTLTFAAYWGGAGGTLIASIPAITAASGITNAPFEYEALLTFRSTTSVTCKLTLDLATSTTTDASGRYVATPTAATSVTTTSNSALAIGFTWSAASASNTISLLGGYTAQLN